MDALKVKRYFEIKQRIKELEAEAKLLHDNIKDQMLKEDITKATVGNYQVQLQSKDRSEMNDTIIPYLKEHGYRDLIVETYNRELFMEYERLGRFDESELAKHRIKKIVHALYVKPC